MWCAFSIFSDPFSVRGDDLKNAWDRMPKETLKAFHAFSLYRDMDPLKRSHRAVAESQGRVSSQVIEKWSSKYEWLDRCRKYDDYRDELKRRSEEQADIELWKQRRKKFREDQFKVGDAMMRVGSAAVVHISKRAASVAPNEAAKLVEVGSAQMSRAMGDPDVSFENKGKQPAPTLIIESEFAQTLLDWAIKPRSDKNEQG